MLQGEHSARLSTLIRLPFVIKIFVLFIFEWPFYTGFTVLLFVKLDKNSFILIAALNIKPTYYKCHIQANYLNRVSLIRVFFCYPFYQNRCTGWAEMYS